MKEVITVTVFMLAVFVHTAGAQQFVPAPRQPFEQQSFSGSKSPLRAPGEGPPTDSDGGGSFNGGTNGSTSGGPAEELPTDSDGGGGWVGMPVSDAFWFLPLMAAGYGLHRKRRMKKN
jgi:ABC-type transport system substrate-binding protein